SRPTAKHFPCIPATGAATDTTGPAKARRHPLCRATQPQVRRLFATSSAGSRLRCRRAKLGSLSARCEKKWRRAPERRGLTPPSCHKSATRSANARRHVETPAPDFSAQNSRAQWRQSWRLGDELEAFERRTG